jgi:alpha-glucoside transport system substrate-binding protein
MELKNRKLFIPIFILVTITFSYFAYSPEEISIAGPYFPQIEYFEEELDLISKDLNVKIRYVPFSDIESEIIRGTNTKEFDLAIIPNPQGVVNLGERGYLHSVSTALDDEVLTKNYSKHLQEITTSQKDNINYGVLFRLIPNSLIWYDVGKYERLGSPNFESFEDMISFTKQYSSFDNPLWCMDIESGASTGWIATNWLEDLILHEYGPDIYDDWFKQIITSQNNEITLSILNIGKLIFDENAVYGGNQRIISKEFRNNYRNLLDEDISCVFSWSGHFASMYFPSNKSYEYDYDFFKFPSKSNKNAMVGIGDSLVILNESNKSMEVFRSLVDDNFGQSWISKRDSAFISGNKNSNIEQIENKMLLKETLLVRNALNEDLFRYDASELMERRIGADHLLYALKKYISLGSEFINEVTEELDSKY